jgi:hypothetical protein
MKKLLLATALTLVFAASAIAQTSQSDQIIPPRDPPLGKPDMGPNTPYESDSEAGYGPNSATGIESRSRGATEPREEFRRRREEKEER